MSNQDMPQAEVDDREKWQREADLREREVKAKEREQQSRAEEVALKREEVRRSRWSSPLVLAVLAATVAAIGNAGVAWWNSREQHRLETERADAVRQLEKSKSEAALILEAIKTGTADPDKAAVNLTFLLDVGLISDPVRHDLQENLKKRMPGEGPALPAAVANSATLPSRFGCGAERIAVKTGTDQDAAKVNTEAEASTIAALAAIAAPTRPIERANTRFDPTELKTFQVKGFLTVIKRELDSDYHIVISDTKGPTKGHTMIVESVDPVCAQGSTFLEQISEVREVIGNKLGQITTKKSPNIPVTVTGVGFFDVIHGQEGIAPNGIELHPILNISF